MALSKLHWIGLETLRRRGGYGVHIKTADGRRWVRYHNAKAACGCVSSAVIPPWVLCLPSRLALMVVLCRLFHGTVSTEAREAQGADRIDPSAEGKS